MLAAVMIFGALVAPVVPHHAAPAVHHPVHHATTVHKHHPARRHHSQAYLARAHEKHVLHLEHLRQVYLREQAAQVRKEQFMDPTYKSLIFEVLACLIIIAYVTACLVIFL